MKIIKYIVKARHDQFILHAKLHRSPVDAQLFHCSPPSLNDITILYDIMIFHDPNTLRTWSILKICKDSCSQNCCDVWYTSHGVNAFTSSKSKDMTDWTGPTKF